MPPKVDLRTTLDALTKSLDAAQIVEMTPEAIEARLRACSDLSPMTFAPLPRVDMSAEAVEVRLQACAEMSALCLELAQLRR